MSVKQDLDGAFAILALRVFLMARRVKFFTTRILHFKHRIFRWYLNIDYISIIFTNEITDNYIKKIIFIMLVISLII
jgi:hypothetical protein